LGITGGFLALLTGFPSVVWFVSITFVPPVKQGERNHASAGSRVGKGPGVRGLTLFFIVLYYHNLNPTPFVL